MNIKQMLKNPPWAENTSEKQKTSDHWSENQSGSSAFSPDVYWLAVPEVQARYQNQGSAGKSDHWVRYCLNEFLQDRLPAERMLSLGCGGGALERDLARLNAFKHCEGLDITQVSIDAAKQSALEEGISNLDYRCVDVENEPLGDSLYDAIWFNGSLHHIKQLEHVCQAVARALKPDGFLFFNEYVGPSMFDLTARQKEVMSAVYRLIPEKYRINYLPENRGRVLPELPFPNPVEVHRVDPSEAIRSAEILSVVEQHFDILAKNQAGGTLMQFLLSGIAGNFKSDDPDSMAVLKLLFSIEDTLINVGDINSDFVVVAARAKK